MDIVEEFGFECLVSGSGGVASSLDGDDVGAIPGRSDCRRCADVKSKCGKSVLIFLE